MPTANLDLRLGSSRDPRLDRHPPIAPPSPTHLAAGTDRLSELAIPAGALARLGELGVWLCGAQACVPPRPLDRVAVVVFAGDHGVSAHGTSAYPAAVTPAMVRAVAQGRAGVSVLARQHGVRLRVLDVAVDQDPAYVADLPEGESVVARRVRRGSGAIHVKDAVSAQEVLRSLALGAEVAAEEIASGVDLLISGDLGIGNTTVAATLIAAVLGLPAADVTGRGTGLDDEGLARKVAVVQAALRRAAEVSDPLDLLRALGGADLAAMVGFQVAAARVGVPVLLDGVISVAAALVAERYAPGTAAWMIAGHRSPEPAHTVALEALGLEPLLDLGLRLGEGSGALAAVPLVRSAALLLGEVASLAEVVG